MRFLAILLTLALIGQVSQAAPDDSIFGFFRDMYDCLRATNIGLFEIVKLARARDEKIACLIKCYHEKRELCINGQLNADNLLKEYERNQPLPPQLRSKVKDCAEKYKECSCNNAILYHKCTFMGIVEWIIDGAPRNILNALN